MRSFNSFFNQLLQVQCDARRKSIKRLRQQTRLVQYTLALKNEKKTQMRHNKCLCCCKSNRMMRKKVKVLFFYTYYIHVYFHFISSRVECVTPRLCVIYTLLLSLGFFARSDTNLFVQGSGCGRGVGVGGQFDCQPVYTTVFKRFKVFSIFFKNIFGLALYAKCWWCGCIYRFFFLCAKVTYFCAHDRCELSAEILWFSLYVCRASAWSCRFEFAIKEILIMDVMYDRVKLYKRLM